MAAIPKNARMPKGSLAASNSDTMLQAFSIIVCWGRGVLSGLEKILKKLEAFGWLVS